MPGIDTRAPERTETSRGRSGSPRRLPAAASSRESALRTCFQRPGGCFLPLASGGGPRPSVLIVKPGGTGTPSLVISASSHPLPPRERAERARAVGVPLAKA